MITSLLAYCLLPIFTEQVLGEIVGGYPTRTSELLLPIGNLSVPVGREATLECVVRRPAKNIKVVWSRAEDGAVLSLDRQVVTHNSRISVTQDRERGVWVLRIKQVRVSDGGCYVCQINTTNMKKQVGCIDVHVPPDILYNQTSPDVSLIEGENATLECRATGRPRPRITWRREDGDLITLRQPSGDLIPVSMFNGSVLHFFKAERSQMGAYLCIASNDVPPAVSKRIILNINFSPVITVPNQLFGSPLSSDLQLQCFVEAFPVSINYWIKNGGDMLLHGSKYSVLENRSKFRTMMWLVIKGLTADDIGTYSCVATNSLGKAEATLRVYAKRPPKSTRLSPPSHAKEEAESWGVTLAPSSAASLHKSQRRLTKSARATDAQDMIIESGHCQNSHNHLVVAGHEATAVLISEDDYREIKLHNSKKIEEDDKQAAYLGELSGPRGRAVSKASKRTVTFIEHILWISWWLFYFR